MPFRRPALSGFLPALPREVGRAAVGAGLGIALCAALAMAFPAVGSFHLALIAPLGATAVLAFAVPNAPLAALNPGPVLEAGPVFALAPVGLMTAALVCAAILFNRATGRVYPFRLAGEKPTEVEEIRLGLSETELAALLQTYRQSSNIGVADLGRLLAAAEREAANHRFDNVSCAEIMTRQLVTVTLEADIRQVARRFREHRIKSLPVVDAQGRLAGLILQADIIEALAAAKLDLRIVGRAPKITAGSIARAADRSTTTNTPVGQILNRLAVQGAETVPVMADERLAGVITRSDIMRLLLAEAGDRRTA